ncbi:MAG: Holliday junction resolvase RuvX [Candidatus Kerfeldbacteria bacterium]|nr:Holliday junction resolvase RuvX [Candidatus Kerfeldbacteria bacterium]
MARILSIDFGEQHVGLALGDSDEGFVVTKPALVGLDTPSLFAALDRLIAVEHVDELLVGLPLTLAGRASRQTQAAQAFIDALRHRLAIPVRTADERLTTSQARRAGVSEDDSAAAALLLTAELERRKHA